jgi:hypothetical protein
MRHWRILAVLALSACASTPDLADPASLGRAPASVSPTALGTVTPVQPSTQNCREFTVPIKVGNEAKEAYGRACEQPDGSWQIVQPEGATPASTVIEHTNVYRSYDPWWGPPYGFGFFGFAGFHHHRHHHR